VFFAPTAAASLSSKYAAFQGQLISERQAKEKEESCHYYCTLITFGQPATAIRPISHLRRLEQLIEQITEGQTGRRPGGGLPTWRCKWISTTTIVTSQ
jgi:hypothetical protein